MFETILLSIERGVATITLNRPSVMNAINARMGRELYQALKQIENNPEVRVLVLRGEGRAFCSGQDLADEESIRNLDNLTDTVRDRYNPLILKLHQLPLPTIAVLTGAAAGAGFSLALACDFRIAAETAVCSVAFNQIGLAPDSGASYFLPRMIGVTRTLEWAFSGRKLAASTLFDAGVVSEVASPDDIEKTVAAWAERFAAGPTRAYALTKQAVYANHNRTLPEALELEAVLQGEAGRTRDFAEGIRSFREKRKPNFQGM